jgi:hypothetical protein
VESYKGLTTVEFEFDQIAALEEFCTQCKLAGYKNNDSIKTMKLEWCLALGGQFFLTYFDNKIISLSGCHPLPEAGNGVYRILFRGATLPRYQNFQGVLSKTHMNSIPFYHHTPKQLAWAKAAGYNDCVITTNHSNKDGILSMNKSHRVLQLLERQKVVSCLNENLLLFNNQQTVWKLNVTDYLVARNRFGQRHEAVGGQHC